MRGIYTLTILFFVHHSMFSQTELQGVINAYTAVLEAQQCSNTIIVEDATSFVEGEDVIVYQAQGAIINTDDSGSFGDILDLGSAGRYEFNTITAIIGNRIELANGLLNEYQIEGRVQLISYPVFENAIVRDTLTALPWNGAIGGVLAFQVSGTLTLEAPINVDGKGFVGGVAGIDGENDCNFLFSVNIYAVGRNDWRGALKGEGVAGFTTGKEAGRGPQGTGGGGGNDHNSGGGGGSLLTSGGSGGNNEEPRRLGCKGRRPGIGGKPIPVFEDRVFLGGGGGAGHDNNGVATDGANGGGIVMLQAMNMVSNNFEISVNGDTPEVGGGDGAGGGGAGGTVLLSVKNEIDGELKIRAQGGQGGFADNQNAERCMGPGGGGSGGFLQVAVPNPIVADLNGGKAGQTINSAVCGDGTNGAKDGESGLLLEWDGVLVGTSQEISIAPAVPDQLISCENENTELVMNVTGEVANWQWQIDRGAGFEDLSNSSSFVGTQTPSLSILRADQEMNELRFRLTAVLACNAEIFSDPISLTVRSLPVPDFAFSASGLSASFFSGSTDADSLAWTFGDGQTSTAVDPTHDYAEPGTYIVRLEVFNDCGNQSITQEIEIAALPTKPTARFSFGNNQGCTPLSVTFTNESSLNASNIQWFFPGGTPGVSTDANPTIRYESPGNYSATLIARNEIGADTLIVNEAVSVAPLPSAAFEVLVEDLTVSLVNNSLESEAYDWDFGDGNTSVSLAPEYTFADYGDYEIRLVASNGCGKDTVVQTVELASALLAGFSVENGMGCAPNFVRFNDRSAGNITRRRWEFPGGDPAVSEETNPTVKYEGVGVYTVRLVVEDANGLDSLLIEDAVTIVASPDPFFTFSMEGSTVTFENQSTNSTAYFWNFGDGTTSVEANPQHTYASGGNYSVTLNAQNNFCANAISEMISVIVTNTLDHSAAAQIRIFPNPVDQNLRITNQSAIRRLQLQIYNGVGQAVKNVYLSELDSSINLNELPAGMYFLEIHDVDRASLITAMKVIKN